ncbi:hypothetical protein BC936DRAFT_145056 [Jimgerdemannia flammicorona]|uniref:beta-glucosidase n=1 Tax=Jimgerdemannia flammicorona TaxID=994334 RepID=A0A433DB10_9FUNG|nr:hypothetical protein BC936DRAFT_145056 [Jimgerdemannia flammicorona]
MAFLIYPPIQASLPYHQRKTTAGQNSRLNLWISGEALHGSNSLGFAYTIAKKASTCPANVLYDSSETPQIDYSEGLFIDYHWPDHKNIGLLYPFGHGLSYTTLSSRSFLSYIQESSPAVSPTVTVAGKVAGVEIVQLYLGFPKWAGEPLKVLRGFQKVFLKSGSTRTVTLGLN